MNSCLQLVKIVVPVILPILGGFAGAYFCPPDDWYKGLNKSKYNPPNWVFAPAWSIFYLCMGFASYLVWKSGGGFEGEAKVPLMLYGSQLILNWAWTPLFFGLHNIIASLIDLSLLLLTAVVCTIAFFKVNRTAGWLMVPYIFWLGYATFLNYEAYTLN